MRSYQLTGRRVISLNFQRRAISVNVPTTEEFLCRLCPEKFSTGSFWREWRTLSILNPGINRQDLGKTDLTQIKWPPSELLWNSPLSGILPCISTSLTIRRHSTVHRETIWKLLRHYGIPSKLVSLIKSNLWRNDLQNNTWRAIFQTVSGPDGGPAELFTIPIPFFAGHRQRRREGMGSSGHCGPS